MMSRCLPIFGIVFFLSLAVTGIASVKIPQGSLGAASRQDLIADQTQDDTWTVIEYPEGQEVLVGLRPTALIPSAKGTARIMHGNDETVVSMEVTGLTGEASSYQVYAVDSLGNATILGTLTVTDGSGSLSEKTALSKFMVVVSPEADLTAIGPETNVALRSSVPGGFIVIPRPGGGGAEGGGGVNVSLRTEPTATGWSEYDVALLGINSLKRGADSQMRVHFANGYEGARANVLIKPHRNGPTEIKVRFYELKQEEDGSHYSLWALAPDNSYTMLGQVIRSGKPGEARVDAVTPFTDFGLFITVESTGAALSSPTGTIVATIVR